MPDPDRERRPPRLWRLSRALPREPAEPFEAARIVEEVGGPLGTLLFQSARDVLLWTRTPPGERASLFAPAAGARRRAELAALDAELVPAAALEILAALVDDPADADAEAMRLACLNLSFWAEAGGMPATASVFARAAAAVPPERAWPTLHVGELAMAAGHRSMAETWLRRAVGLARRSREWASYAGALLALGRLEEERGRPAEAEAWFTRAFRAGRRNALRETRGQAAAGLSRVHQAAGRAGDAERWLRRALRVLGRPHPDRPELLRRHAGLLLERGEPAEAARALRAALPGCVDPARRMEALAQLARAAAEAGDRRLMEKSWTEAWLLVEDRPRDDATLRALVELTRAASQVGDWRRMQRAAAWSFDDARGGGLDPDREDGAP